MNRRGFLKLFAGAAAGAVVAPKVSYFFAPKAGWPYPFATGGIATNGYWNTPGALTIADIEATLESMSKFTFSPPGIWCSAEAYQEMARLCEPAELTRRTSLDDGVLYVDLRPHPLLLGGEMIPVSGPMKAPPLPRSFPLGV